MQGTKRRKVQEWRQAEITRLEAEIEKLGPAHEGFSWWEEVQLGMLTRGNLLSWQHVKRLIRRGKLTKAQRKRHWAKIWRAEHTELRKAYAAKQRRSR